MPFVQGKCESCGGILTVDPSLKAANCPFCGAAYVVQDSINYYNTTVKVDNLHADVVNVTDESTSEGRLKAADAYMQLDKFEEATTEYKKVTELTPQNHLGWLGLIEAKTNKYTKRITSAHALSELSDFCKSVITFAPEGTGEELVSPCEVYISEEKQKNESDLKQLKATLSEKQAEISKLEEQERSWEKELAKCIQLRLSVLDKIGKLETEKGKDPINTVLVLGILMIVVGIIFIAFIAFFVGMIIAGFGALLLIYSIAYKASFASKRKKLIGFEKDINEISSIIKGIKHDKEVTTMVVNSKRKQIEQYS